MNTVTQIQIMDEAVFISYIGNTLEEMYESNYSFFGSR